MLDVARALNYLHAKGVVHMVSTRLAVKPAGRDCDRLPVALLPFCTCTVNLVVHRAEHPPAEQLTALSMPPCHAPTHARTQDVKGGNVLLTDRGVAKLADVGTSRLQTHTFLSELPGVVGTFDW